MSHLQGLFFSKVLSRCGLAIFGLFLLGAVPLNLKAQDDLNIHGVVSDAMSSSKLSDVTVTVKKDGANHNTFTTRANGKYEFYLDCNAHYELEFEKPGYIKRTIIIDSKGVPEEVIGAGIIMPTDMSMYAMTEAMEGADLSVFDQPIGKAKYDPAQSDLVWDFAHTNKVKSEIFAFIRDVEKRQKELDKEASAAEKEAEENEAKFKKFVADGDDAMVKKNFEDAVLNYTAALEIKPGDPPVDAKLGEAQTKLAAKKAAEKLENDYSAALDAGDGFMRTEEFQKAIEKYNEALALKAGEEYPQTQIAEANRILEERAANMAKQEQFNKLMAEADGKFAEKKYQESIKPYEDALKIFPDNSEAQRKLRNAKDAFANEAAMAEKQASYDALIADADGLFKKEAYEEALPKYQEASKIFPDEAYPKDRIAAAEEKLAALAQAAANKEAYDAAMLAGDKLLVDSKYREAIEKYEEALELVPNDTKATTQIAEAEGLLAEIEAEAQKQEQYDALIVSADDLFKAEDYPGAKTKYEEARKLIPAETYPMDQLAKIEKLLAELAEAEATQAAYQEAMEAGAGFETSKEYSKAIDSYNLALAAIPGDKAAIDALANAEKLKSEYEAQLDQEQAYNDAIAAGDAFFGEEKYTEAKAEYERALGVKSGEEYPESQIEKIENKLADLERAAEEAAALAEKEAAFQAEFDAGIAAITKEDYVEAISRFEAALQILENDEEALTKLEEAKNKLAEKQASAEVDEQYAEWIGRGDTKFTDSALEDALAAYTEASKLKPAEAYPKDQINLIEERIAAEAQAAADAEMAAKTEQVNALVLEGDQLVKNNSFNNGIAKYEEALAILPERKDIEQKIAEATNAMLAYQEAAGLDEAYSAALTEADAQFESKNWNRARSAYENAGKIKPDEAYPKDQIVLIEENIAAEVAAAEKEKNDKVAALLLEGDQLVKEKKFEAAIAKYEDAQSIFPDRTDISAKIDAANNAFISYTEAANLDEAYSEAIAAGDADFEKSKWESAKQSYQSALEMKSQEAYPAAQIELIDQKLKEIEEAEALALRLKNQEEFEKLIASGDKSLARRKYESALEDYENALSLIPESELAIEKIGEVNKLLGKLDEEQAKRKEYEELIADADELYEEESYEMARLKYLDAQAIFSDEKYPPKRITEIDIILEKLRLAEEASAEAEMNARYRAEIKKADGHMAATEYSEAVSAYRDALEIKPDERYPQSQIERVELLIAEREADEKERERLAALEAAAGKGRKKVDENQSGVNTNSEEQAEQFMREAREAQEKEKYERIKKLKNKNLENTRSYSENADLDRTAQYASLQAYRENADKRYSEASASKEKSVANSVKYKKALLENKKKQAAIGDVRRKDAYNETLEAEENREAFFEQKTEEQNKKIEAERKANEAYADLIKKWQEESVSKRFEYNNELDETSAKRVTENKKAEERREEDTKEITKQQSAHSNMMSQLAKENLENARKEGAEREAQKQEQTAVYTEKNDSKVNEGAAEIERQKEQQSSALDDRKQLADTRREQALEDLKQVKSGGPKEYNEYYRTELAENYPQGVSEESSTLGNKVIITRIVVKGNKGDEYKKVLDKAGNYYFKNGQSISEYTWDRETIDAFRSSKD